MFFHDSGIKMVCIQIYANDVAYGNMLRLDTTTTTMVGRLVHGPSGLNMIGQTPFLLFSGNLLPDKWKYTLTQRMSSKVLE
jgi:hypothetical protein